jgi:hypothetical protein
MDQRLADALKYGRANGDKELHLAQYKSAVKNNNVKMQQWLGVQRLGQSYRPDPMTSQKRLEQDVFEALGVDPQLLSEDDIDVLLKIVEKGRPKEQAEEGEDGTK